MTQNDTYANAFGSTFAFLANTLCPTKMQKSYQANAQGTYSAALDKLFSLTDQDEGRTHNMGFAKMGVDGSRVSTFVFQFGFISSLTLLI